MIVDGIKTQLELAFIISDYCKSRYSKLQSKNAVLKRRLDKLLSIDAFRVCQGEVDVSRRSLTY